MNTISTILASTAVAITATFGMAADAQAQQQQCGPRADVMETLATQYGETLQSVGISSDGMIVEQFANAASGSWTYTISPDGQTSCMVAAGQGFVDLSTEIPAADAGIVPQSIGQDGNGVLYSTVADESAGNWGVMAILPTGQAQPVIIGSDFIDTNKAPVIRTPNP